MHRYVIVYLPETGEKQPDSCAVGRSQSCRFSCARFIKENKMKKWYRGIAYLVYKFILHSYLWNVKIVGNPMREWYSVFYFISFTSNSIRKLLFYFLDTDASSIQQDHDRVSRKTENEVSRFYSKSLVHSYRSAYRSKYRWHLESSILGYYSISRAHASSARSLRLQHVCARTGKVNSRLSDLLPNDTIGCATFTRDWSENSEFIIPCRHDFCDGFLFSFRKNSIINRTWWSWGYRVTLVRIWHIGMQ